MGRPMATTHFDYPVAFNRYILGTDGIVECVDDHGRVYGYLKMAELPETHLTLSRHHLKKLLVRFT